MTTDLSFLLSEYRKRVLSLLLLHPKMQYHVREIARLTNTTAGSLHRELAKLAKSNILLRQVSGNQVYYQANPHFLIFNELASILKKTAGIADVLTNALAPLTEKINMALIFGSIANETATSASDIDILIIGDLSFIDAVKALHPAQNTLQREINPKIYTKSEWEKLVSAKHPFAQEVLKKPKIFIIGNSHDLK